MMNLQYHQGLLHHFVGAFMSDVLAKHCLNIQSVCITLLFDVQRWDGKTQLIENGIYLGHIASLQFAGPWKMTKVISMVH